MTVIVWVQSSEMGGATYWGRRKWFQVLKNEIPFFFLTPTHVLIIAALTAHFHHLLWHSSCVFLLMNCCNYEFHHLRSTCTGRKTSDGLTDGSLPIRLLLGNGRTVVCGFSDLLTLSCVKGQTEEKPSNRNKESNSTLSHVSASIMTDLVSVIQEAGLDLIGVFSAFVYKITCFSISLFFDF